MLDLKIKTDWKKKNSKGNNEREKERKVKENREIENCRK